MTQNSFIVHTQTISQDINAVNNLSLPKYGEIPNDNPPNKTGNLIFCIEDNVFYGHDNTRWVPFNTIGEIYDQRTFNPKDDPKQGFNFYPTWSGFAFVQNRNHVGHLNMRIVSTLPIMQQQTVIITLPDGFKPIQDLNNIPLYTTFDPEPLNIEPTHQYGKLSILKNGNITNLLTLEDKPLILDQHGEYFDINVILPL